MYGQRLRQVPQGPAPEVWELHRPDSAPWHRSVPGHLTCGKMVRWLTDTTPPAASERGTDGRKFVAAGCLPGRAAGLAGGHRDRGMGSPNEQSGVPPVVPAAV